MRFDVLGASTYVYTGGRERQPGLPTVVLIHGAQNDHSVWILQSRYLAHHGFDVLVPDLPGHGRSLQAPLSTIESMADWLLALLDAAGAERAALIGHSMGSLIALEAAGRAPQRASHLALVGSAFPMKVSDTLLDAARDDEPAAIDMICNWSHSGISHKPGTPGPGFSVFGQNKRLMQRQRAGLLSIDFSACNAYVGGLQAAARVRCPTSLIGGSLDQMTPIRASHALRDALAVAATSAGLPAPVSVALPDCGHDIMAEQPEGLLNALRSLLASRPAGA